MRCGQSGIARSHHFWLNVSFLLIFAAQRIARPGPSKVARIPSPVVLSRATIAKVAKRLKQTA
jgi:hypothetical protein